MDQARSAQPGRLHHQARRARIGGSCGAGKRLITSGSSAASPYVIAIMRVVP